MIIPFDIVCVGISSVVILNWIGGILFLVKLSFGEVKSVWLAHRHFERDKHRYKNQPSINMLKHFTESNRSVVVDYYLKGKRIF